MLERHRKGLAPVSAEYSGNYVVVVLDAKGCTIAVQPDRWAMHAIYVASVRGVTAISNRAALVASRVGAAFDGYALMSFMRGTHIPFPRTLFSGVHRMMCGSYVSVDLPLPGQAKIERAFGVNEAIRPGSRKECVERIVEALQSTARRLTATESVFDLTGGNDTRLMAAAMASVTRRGSGESFYWRVSGTDRDPDVKIAQSVADRLGWRLVTLERSRVSDAELGSLRGAAIMADGTCLVNTAFARLAQEKQAGLQSQWLVGSLGGEVLRGFFWRHDLASLPKRDGVNYDALLRQRLYVSSVEAGVFDESAPGGEAYNAELLRGYRAIGAAGSGLPGAYQLDAMYVHKLCYSGGNFLSWLAGAGIGVKLPLLASEVLDVALSIPWWWRVTRGVVLRAIEELEGVLGAVPNDRGEPMRPLRPKTSVRYALSLARLAPPVVARLLRGARTGEPAGVSVSILPPDSWRSLVKESSILRKLVSGAAVNAICAKVAVPTASAEAVRAFYVLATAGLLLDGVPGLKPEIVFAPLDETNRYGRRPRHNGSPGGSG